MFGKQNFNHSETEVGQKPENVLLVTNTKTVRETDSITGMAEKKMYLCVIMKSLYDKK
jgi:hypothetical protein